MAGLLNLTRGATAGLAKTLLSLGGMVSPLPSASSTAVDLLLRPLYLPLVHTLVPPGMGRVWNLSTPAVPLAASKNSEAEVDMEAT